MRPYIIRIQALFTDTLTWNEKIAVRVVASDQAELDRMSDEILNTWLEQNPNNPATYVQTLWRPNYSV